MKLCHTNTSDEIISKNFTYKYLFVCPLLLLFSCPTLADWEIVTHTNIDNNLQTTIAHTENSEGYSLEIYRDGNGAVRSRFSMNNNINRLDGETCPTYQVDKRPIQNRSINDAPCIASEKWSEFVLGYIIEKKVTSTLLHNIMNGNRITYRFAIEPYGYTETTFSLIGSKRALTEALGSDVAVLTDNGFSN